jgi:16S rRNA (adenine(1408)-N(1))-methyltransferase
METIMGKQARPLSADELAQRLDGYRNLLIDLGTGDGRFVLHAARHDPHLFAVGVDACRENLHRASRSAPSNALFVISSAQALPQELHGLASRLAVNFPWGSLLTGLLDSDPSLLDGMRSLMQPGAALEIRLNASALAEAGWTLEAGGAQVYKVLREAGFRLRQLKLLDSAALRTVPTTWAKRTAYGRRPEAVEIYS